MLAHKLLSIDYLEQSIDFKKKIYIAFSGGIDSSVLVDILGKNVSKYNLDITVIHINHNISPNSAIWMKHCKDFCCKLDLKFRLAKGPRDGHGHAIAKSTWTITAGVEKRSQRMS